MYPATWETNTFNEFARMTGHYINKTFSNLKNSQSGVVNVIGAGNLNSPNMSVLQPLLAQDAVEGIFWYTFGAGYSGWTSTEFDTDTKKPVIGGRVSLWGNSTSGTMLGVKSIIKHLKTLLQNKEINSNIDDVNGYSLIPVNVWSHSVDDVVTVANALIQTGNFEIITPTELLNDVKTNCKP